MSSENNIGIELLKKAIQAKWSISLSRDGELVVRNTANNFDAQLVSELKRNKPAVVETIRSGRNLIRKLWALGYGTRIEKGTNGRLFILVTGSPQLTDDERQALVAEYNANHDAALWGILASIDRKGDSPNGEPDYESWNAKVEDYIRRQNVRSGENVRRTANVETG